MKKHNSFSLTSAYIIIIMIIISVALAWDAKMPALNVSIYMAVLHGLVMTFLLFALGVFLRKVFKVHGPQPAALVSITIIISSDVIYSCARHEIVYFVTSNLFYITGITLAFAMPLRDVG